LGIVFTEYDNERLKGVSRMESLDILLSLGSAKYSEAQKDIWAQEKNKRYVEYVDKMTSDELLPGVSEFVRECKNIGCKISLGSVSNNSTRILKRLKIEHLFDYIVDGTCVTNAKPNPEVFLKSSEHFGFAPQESVVFEDATAGVEAARRAKMYCVGVGSPEILTNADMVISSFVDLSALDVFHYLQNNQEAHYELSNKEK
jgi:beta-phosphoglucomutase